MELEEGIEITLNAIPDKDYVFKTYDIDDIATTDNPLKYTLVDDITIGLNFEKI